MRLSLVIAIIVAAGVVASSASADGLPVLDIDAGPSGVAGQHVRYVTLEDDGNTFLERIEQPSGRVLGARLLRGRFTIPAVAYDGSASGLSVDGRVLVLITPRPTFPRANTTFAVIDLRRLRLEKTITLRGDFSFDALSPDGRWMYLIHYASGVDPLRYQVRAYDLVRARLDPKPVVDPREPEEPMNGRPLTRTTSPDGRWAYTLYEGAEHPFVHALDTVGRDARCIDLDWLTGRDDLWLLRFGLTSNGRNLSLRTRGGERVAVVDTETFAASLPTENVRRWPWLIPAAVLLALAAVFLVYRAGWRRRAASTSLGGATSA